MTVGSPQPVNDPEAEQVVDRVSRMTNSGTVYRYTQVPR